MPRMHALTTGAWAGTGRCYSAEAWEAPFTLCGQAGWISYSSGYWPVTCRKCLGHMEGLACPWPKPFGW